VRRGGQIFLHEACIDADPCSSAQPPHNGCSRPAYLS
jgi:hypothetical protein